MLEIYVDADACPVKEEVGRVAKRYNLNVIYVANSWMGIPDQENARMVVVEGLPDAADNWIAEHALENDIVITSDIPLAYRCIQKGACVLGQGGRVLSEENIGQILATRDLMLELREAGTVTGGGQPPFQKQDRSKFLHAFDQMIQQIKRKNQKTI